MIQEICKDEKFLAQKAEQATPDDIQTATDLLETLEAHKDGCVGMAANMIGVNKRIIAFDNEGTYMVMFNPQIVKQSGGYEAEEGCLSLTGTRKTRMGYTQQQVADALGLTASTYCGYETGKRQPDVAKLKQLARILNTTGSFLLETEPVQDTCRPDLGAGNELMASYGRLNERSKKAVDDLVALLLDLQEKSKE